MNDNEFTIGVDIGGTNTVLGAVDCDGECTITSSFPTAQHGGAVQFVKALASSIGEMCRQLPARSSLRGIGLAAPAARHREGVVRNPANIAWGTVNLVSMLKQYFTLPVALTNDSNAAALGEMYFGAAKGKKNFIAVTLGTGLGAGVIVDGRLLYGHSDLAGELGHVILEPNGRECGCQRKGCAETYVSAPGICRTVFEVLARRNTRSTLRGLSFDALTARTIFELAAKGDPIALEAFEITGSYLGILLVNAIAAFDSEAIILSGGVAEAGEILFRPTREYFDANILSLQKGNVEILGSTLKNGQAAILGASCLVGYGSGSFDPSPRKKENMSSVSSVVAGL